MTDTFNVTAAYDKANYAQGETITATISGDDVHVVQSQGQAGPLDLTVQAQGGAQQVISVPSVAVTITTTTHESVKIIGVVDTGPTPRTWSIDASGTKVTATA